MATNPHGNSAGSLVVFGCGYVGSAVAELAVKRGYTVTALTRNAVKASVLRDKGINVVEADLASDAWHRRIEPPRLILNSVSASSPGPEGYEHSYVSGMRSLTQWAARAGGAPSCVYTSSTAVYPQDGGVLVAESDALPLSDVTGGRGALLRAAEELLTKNEGGIGRWFILRLAGIYGPERMHLVSQVRTGVVSGTPDHHLNLAHRDDIVAAIWACFDAPPEVANQVYNVADDSRATKGEVAQWLAQKLELPLPRFTGAPVAGRTAVPDRIVSNAKIKADLGWRPKYPTFREGYMPLLGSEAKP